MTRYCCPDYEDHSILDDDLRCPFCEGAYIWLSLKEAKKVKEILKKEKAKKCQT